MTQASRRSYGHFLAMIAAIVALSGVNQILVSMDADIFEVSATPLQASELDYDFEISDSLDERHQNLIEDLLDSEVDSRIPPILPKLVFLPYMAMGLIGVLALVGFRSWGRTLGITAILVSAAVLAATMTVEQAIPLVIDRMAERTLPQDLEISPSGQGGPALLRMEIGAVMGMVAGLIGLFRPDRA